MHVTTPQQTEGGGCGGGCSEPGEPGSHGEPGCSAAPAAEDRSLYHGIMVPSFSICKSARPLVKASQAAPEKGSNTCHEGPLGALGQGNSPPFETRLLTADLHGRSLIQFSILHLNLLLGTGGGTIMLSSHIPGPRERVWALSFHSPKLAVWRWPDTRTQIVVTPLGQ